MSDNLPEAQMLASAEHATRVADTPDRESLFRLLTEEIRDLAEDEKLRGWTPWVLTASLVSVGWLMVQDLWTKQISLRPSITVFLALSLAITILQIVASLVHDLSARERSRSGFVFLHATNTPLHAVTLILWFTAMTIACFAIRSDVSHSLLTGVGVTFAVSAVLFAFVLLAVAVRLPVPVHQRTTRGSFVISAAMVILYGFAIAALLRSSVLHSATISDLRAGGLVALSSFAIIIASRGYGRHGLMRQTLTEIRRDVILGTIPLDEARHRARTALQGMWLSDVVRDDVRVLLGHISAVRSLYEEAFRKIEILKTAVPIENSNDVRLAPFEKDAVSNTLEVLQSIEMRIRTISRQYFTLSANVRNRLHVVARVIGEKKTDEGALLMETRRAQAQVDADLLKFVRDFDTIQSAWNRWFPDERRDHKPFDTAVKDAFQA